MRVANTSQNTESGVVSVTVVTVLIFGVVPLKQRVGQRGRAEIQKALELGRAAGPPPWRR